MGSTATDRTLDVREIDGPPFSEIMAALEELGENDRLQLLVDHEPVPLYGVLEQRGFSHESDAIDGVWHVQIEHS